MIYGYLLPRTYIKKLRKKDLSDSFSILRICKTINKEATEMLYSKGAFRRKLSHGRRNLPSESIDQVKKGGFVFK